MTLQSQEDPEHRWVGGGDGSPIDTSCKKFDVKVKIPPISIGANNGRPMWQPTTPISSTSPSVIYTPSPVLKGVSYASAARAFIPPPPYKSSPTAIANKHENSSDDDQPSIAPIVGNSTDTEESSINDEDGVYISKDNKRTSFIEVIQDTAMANSGTICKILSVICLAWLIQIRREQPPTSILSLMMGVLLVILIQNMDIPSKMVSAISIRCTHFISSLFLLPELDSSTLLITIVRFIILSGLIQTAYQLIISSIQYQNKCKEEIARQEKEALILSQQRELEQHALKVWQENQRRKQQEETNRIEEQRLLKEQEILAKQYNCHGSSRRDDQKRKYLTHADAEEAIASMRLQGKDKDLTLMSYYNPVYGRWFIGRAGWMFNNEDMCSDRSTPTPLVGKSQAIGCM